MSLINTTRKFQVSNSKVLFLNKSLLKFQLHFTYRFSEHKDRLLESHTFVPEAQLPLWGRGRDVPYTSGSVSPFRSVGSDWSHVWTHPSRRNGNTRSTLSSAPCTPCWDRSPVSPPACMLRFTETLAIIHSKSSTVYNPACWLKVPRAHPPWPRPPARWPRPVRYTPTSHSILLEPAPYVGTDSPDPGASRPGYSEGRSWSVHRDTHTDNCSSGRTSLRCGTSSCPSHRSLHQELLTR